MAKLKEGDRVRIRGTGQEGTVIQPDGMGLPQYAPLSREREQLWEVQFKGAEWPDIVAESDLEKV